ncbi:heavy-metal-associated domain-containing protein [Nocardioides sp. SR21]|uniref:heavy-metal-associated domain-containing protein n=1 Tax=Nocardioides sp. SR21 TaxID=2919501 RepID=UPI001FA992F9|nr:heavy-metal-associated domain-containing protein [Nocardioides sp. SR21]
MNTPARLGLYGAGLAVLFVGAFAAAGAVVPQSTVDSWTQEAEGHDMGAEGAGGHGDAHAPAAPTAVRGVSSAQDGYLLTPVAAPDEVDESGTLSFRIHDAHGEALTSFATEHDKELHLIVVRTDGSRFRHVHPTMAADGTWSLPWEWAAAGTYRVYADFVPGGEGEGDPVTLTRTVDVAGPFAPVVPVPADVATVDGFTVELVGDLAVGESSQLTLSVSRGGEPVTTLQPYLGAFGHLVALREGDLAYLHVHPEGDEPAAGETSGPEISFLAEAPTPGRYLLYLDFQVDGQVHSAPFVVDAHAH